LKLDVGCGSYPTGDVNVDLFVNTLQGHFSGITMTKADIIADGNYLPFKTNTFDKVVSRQTIEHTITPFCFLKELIRVSNHEVEITCPHRFSRHSKLPYHVSYFNKKWFDKACSLLNLRRNFRITTNLELFKIWRIVLPLVRPYDLVVRIFKEGGK